jgi:hypothetical protein
MIISNNRHANPSRAPSCIKLNTEEAAALCIIRVRPAGKFLTYGVGVSMQTMRKPELSSGRAPV